MTQDPMSAAESGTPARPRSEAAREKPGLLGRLLVPLALLGVVAAVLSGGYVLLLRAEENVNQVALSAEPKAVSAVHARATEYRARRRYVATLEPWQTARVGPQLASGFVGSVLVRPGAQVKRGQVLATLDCRNASAASQAIALQARSLEARQRAARHEAARIQEMLEGGYVSPNEVEQALAQAAAREAQIKSLMAEVSGKRLEVNDCVLRAPFDGEIAERLVDPGAFVRPGTPLLTVVDRGVVRLVGDVPEVDYAVVAPGTSARIRLLATGRALTGGVARRSPAGSAATRTIRFEIDLDDTRHEIPVGTTAEVEFDVGEPLKALELPLVAAQVRGKRATVFVVRGERVEKRFLDVLGEREGNLYVSPTLEADATVVTQGRGLLADGDAVAVKTEAWP